MARNFDCCPRLLEPQEVKVVVTAHVKHVRIIRALHLMATPVDDSISIFANKDHTETATSLEFEKSCPAKTAAIENIFNSMQAVISATTI